MNDEISSSDTVRGKRPNSEMTRDPRFPNLPADLPALAHLRAILEWYEARGQEKNPERPSEWPYHYVFTALRLSKSYYMAQQVAQKKLRRTEVNIADFDQVEQVYKDLGPVHGMVFHDWLHNLKPGLFEPENPAMIRQLCTLDVGDNLDAPAVQQKIHEGIESYRADRLNDKQPKVTLVAIPAHGSKKEIMQLLEEHLDKHYASEEIIYDIKYPIKISGQKRAIQNSLDVLEKKAQNPFIRAQDLLSNCPTSGRGKNITHTNDQSRRMSHSNSKKVKRWLDHGQIISENAARGRFFDKEKITGFDYQFATHLERHGYEEEYKLVNKTRKRQIIDLSQKDREWKAYLGIL